MTQAIEPNYREDAPTFAPSDRAGQSNWRKPLALLIPLLALPLVLMLVKGMAAQGPALHTTCDVPTAGHPTIQSAVDDPACTMVNVAAGTFYENVVISRDVTLQGQGMDKTRVNGGGNDRVVSIEPAHAVTLTQLTITNGKAKQAPGGGGVLSRDSTLILDTVALTGNSAVQWGGAVSFISLDGARSLTIYRSRIEGNTASEIAGAVYHAGVAAEISDSLIAGNTAAACGAVSNSGQQPDLVSIMLISNTVVEKNSGADATGGLCNEPNAHLTVVHSLVSSNEGLGPGGGGIQNKGLMLIKNSNIVNNYDLGDGGGIANNGALTITFSTLSNNRAIDGNGGAILNYNGKLTLDHSTIDGNYAEGDGGGIFIWGLTKLVALSNSTLSGNSALGAGGAIKVASIAPTQVTINNSTLADNSAEEGGGGIWSVSSVSMSNTIVGGNESGGDCYNPVKSLGYNIDHDGTCQLTAMGDQPNTDPLLGSLQDNGGPTWTHALLSGSPAIDSASPTTPGSGGGACELSDQRGVARPQVGDDDGLAARCDIGAYEQWMSAERLFLPQMIGEPQFSAVE